MVELQQTNYRWQSGENLRKRIIMRKRTMPEVIEEARAYAIKADVLVAIFEHDEHIDYTDYNSYKRIFRHNCTIEYTISPDGTAKRQ